MTERDFVLNNFYTNQLKEMEDTLTIDALKQTYKTICENTSEEGDDFIIKRDKYIGTFKGDFNAKFEYKNIVSFEDCNEMGDCIIKLIFINGTSFNLYEQEKERFKQWFERKQAENEYTSL